MNLFNNSQDATNYITEQLNRVKRLARLPQPEHWTVKDILASYAAGICEAILYICCEEDSDQDGIVPFPRLKDLPKYCHNFSPMNVPYDVANAAKEISKAEKVDIFNPMDDFADRVIHDMISIFLPWIIDNARCESAKDFARGLKDILMSF